MKKQIKLQMLHSQSREGRTLRMKDFAAFYYGNLFPYLTMKNGASRFSPLVAVSLALPKLKAFTFQTKPRKWLIPMPLELPEKC
jgi:hypothetical protein